MEHHSRTGVKMTKSGDNYVAKNVKFELTTGETKCYFNLTDYVASTWDDLNISANRYGAATEGEAITTERPQPSLPISRISMPQVANHGPSLPAPMTSPSTSPRKPSSL